LKKAWAVDVQRSHVPPSLRRDWLQGHVLALRMRLEADVLGLQIPFKVDIGRAALDARFGRNHGRVGVSLGLKVHIAYMQFELLSCAIMHSLPT